MNTDRRSFLQKLSLSGIAVAVASPIFATGRAVAATTINTEKAMNVAQSNFKISLAQWSLHKSFFGNTLAKGWGHFVETLQDNPDALLQGALHPNDFPAIAREQFGIDTIELVNTFYFSKAGDHDYWHAFKIQCQQLGVQVGLIMCDALGDLGDADENTRNAAVKNHYAWVDIAQMLGAHSIRVNASGQGSAEELAANAADGLASLAAYGATKRVNIVVENHGGYSSNGQWLAAVIRAVNSPYCGTLPDFGNFCLEGSPGDCIREYDRYKGVAELAPLAKGLSAKAYDFDNMGNETTIDFLRMMQIARDAGYRGHVGIEYEGHSLTETQGIKATQLLLNRCFSEL
ncbi:MAG: sugar phosphate isomerase/epimerase family protein [Halioglobus sp.]